jgi:hypothetical protein
MAKNSPKEKAEQLGKRAVPSINPNLDITNRPPVPSCLSNLAITNQQIAALNEAMSKVDPSKLKF